MKPKKFDKKLTLNKKTISNLANGEMNDVYGGRPHTYQPCTNGTACVTCTCDPTWYPRQPCCY
jgi:natural product precursor